MRIALIADIHGNSIALDAVLADIEARGGVDAYWVLGDLCAVGFDPAGVIDRLAGLKNALFVRGNADRYVGEGTYPPPTLDKTRDNPDLLPVFQEVAASFGWTIGHLAGRDRLNWLTTLPYEHRLTLPDNTSVLLVHSSPDSDEDPGFNPSLKDEEFRSLTLNANADLIAVGHFHLPLDRTVGGVRVINPGAVSNNFLPDLRASYAVLTADQAGFTVQHFRIPYDIQAAINATLHSSNPGSKFIVRVLSGQIRGSWMQRWDGVSHVIFA
jgi:predicted phosphodiesterase